MRSRGVDELVSLSAAACVLRYASTCARPAPAAAARFWQCASAPAIPPRLAPLPGPRSSRRTSCPPDPAAARRSSPATPTRPPLPLCFAFWVSLFAPPQGFVAVGTRARGILGVTPRCASTAGDSLLFRPMIIRQDDLTGPEIRALLEEHLRPHA
jgi:hypothetical protein